MSAIVGIYVLDDRPMDHVGLEQMLNALAHRGPDGANLWSVGPVGLGHRMLWTTPESLQEHLPLAVQGGALVITADARIDNRHELLEVLDVRDRPSGRITDSQIILAAYEKWGEHCPEYLLGDFAFAIWNRRTHVLFCARDHFGVKPLYYFHRPHKLLAFASEIKALFRLPEVPRHLNECRVADLLVRSFEDKENTLYQDIWRLPAGHSMIIGREGVRLRSYWSPDLSREVRLRSDGEYAEAFREIFTEAVRCRLRSAFPMGSMLSGGLDSSSIVCTARRLLTGEAKRRLHTFSAIFPSLPETDLRQIDERRYISAVVAMGGVDPYYVHADRLSPLTDVDRLLWHMDEAIFAPNLYMHWALYSAAYQAGNRVLLDGIDGDSTVSHGFEYLTELARTGRWMALYIESAALSRQSKTFRPLRKAIWRLGFRPLLPACAVHLWRTLHRRTTHAWAGKGLINPIFARRTGVADRTETLLRRESAPARSAREQHWRGLASGVFPYALELADKAAAAFSLEPRYPFFDRRMIEFCLAIPAGQKLHQGWTRMIMRRAMTDILPKEVQWRFAKANLFPNFKRQLLGYEQEILEEVILKNPYVIEPYVDLPALGAAYRRYASHPMQAEKEALAVYSAVILDRWLRQAGFATSQPSSSSQRRSSLYLVKHHAWIVTFSFKFGQVPLDTFPVL